MLCRRGFVEEAEESFGYINCQQSQIYQVGDQISNFCKFVVFLIWIGSGTRILKRQESMSSRIVSGAWPVANIRPTSALLEPLILRYPSVISMRST